MEGFFLFGTFLIRHQIEKVYENNILHSVYSKFKENICLNLFFLSRKALVFSVFLKAF